MSSQWEDYDPEWLVELAMASPEAMADHPWLPSALRRCTCCLRESTAYIYFVEAVRPNEPGSHWQFDVCVVLEHPVEGELVLDLLKYERVGGVEFLSRLGVGS